MNKFETTVNTTNQSIIKVYILGAPRIVVDDQLIKFRSRKILALFIYLAVTGKSHTRDHLMVLFWPNSDRKRASISLRNSISRLEAAFPSPERILKLDNRLVGLKQGQQILLDVALIHQANQSTASLEDWEAVQEAVAGDFLAGFSIADSLTFDEWMIVQREFWQQQVSLVFERLTKAYLQNAQSELAIQTSSHWLSLIPINETAYRQLMKAHGLTGNRAAALKVFESCKKMLHDELGVEPLPETIQLMEKIKSEPIKAQVIGNSLLSPEPVVKSEIFKELPLIGRRQHHQRLVTTYHMARQGTPQLIAITGESGIGKTRLVNSFFQWLYLQSFETEFLNGRTFEFGGQMAYQPLVNMFRDRLEKENAPEDLLTDVWLSELSRFMPELRERYPDLPPPASGESDFERTRFFEAMAQLGQSFAAKKPVLIFLDDLHWADHGTFDLLYYLLGRWQEWQLPIAIVATLRAEQISTSPILSDWLSRLGRDVPLIQLELTLLTYQDVVELIRLIGTQAATLAEREQLANWLFTESGGHPFFITEMLQMLLERNQLLRPIQGEEQKLDIGDVVAYLGKVEAVPIPANIRDLIKLRFMSQSVGAKALLLAAAVLGQAAQFEEIIEVAGFDELSAISDLEALIHANLLTEESESLSPYTFSHDYIREIVYTEAGEARRRIYHRRALMMLENRQNTVASQLAFHALAAKQYADAFRYVVAAGEAALGSFSATDAIGHFNQALTLAKTNLDTDHSELNLTLYLQRGRAFELANQYSDALGNYQAMQQVAETTHNFNLLLQALLAQALIYSLPTQLHNPTKGREISHRVLTMAQTASNREVEARVLWCLLLVELHDLTDKDQAWAYGQAGLEIAEELGLEALAAYILNDLHKVAMLQADTVSAKNTIKQAIAYWQKAGNLPMLMDSYTNVSFLYCSVGQFNTALETTQRCLDLATELKNQWHLMNAAPSSIWAKREKGQYSDAIALLQESIELSKPFGEIYLFSYSFSLAVLYLDLGAVGKVRELCQVAKRPGIHEGYAGFLKLADSFRYLELRVALLEGDSLPEQAYDLFVEQIRQTRYFHPSVPLSWLSVCEAALSQQKFDVTVHISEAIITSMEQFSIKLYLADAYYYLGRGFIGRGEKDMAIASFQKAASIANAIGAIRIHWQILAAFADTKEQQEENDKAFAIRQEARAALEPVIEQIPEGELRASFLALPAVDMLLA